MVKSQRENARKVFSTATHKAIAKMAAFTMGRPGDAGALVPESCNKANNTIQGVMQ